jgi:hypothetical protein
MKQASLCSSSVHGGGKRRGKTFQFNPGPRHPGREREMIRAGCDVERCPRCGGHWGASDSSRAIRAGNRGTASGRERPTANASGSSSTATARCRPEPLVRRVPWEPGRATVGARPTARRLVAGHGLRAFRRSMTTPLKYGSMIDNAVQRVANENDRIINPPTDNVVSLPHSQSRPR